MSSAHADNFRPSLWRLATLSKPQKCPACGELVELSRPARHLVGVLDLVCLVISFAFTIQQQSYLPFGIGLAIILLSQLLLSRFGPVAVVSTQELKVRRWVDRIALLLFIVIPVIYFIAIKF